MSHDNFRASGSILTKLFPFDVPQGRGDNVGTIFGSPPPLKFGRAKNVKNSDSARFLTTFDFDRDYLQNGSLRRKSVKTIINYNPFHVGPKKFGELWSANNRVIVAHIDQRKWTFFGRLHFGH